MAEELHVWDGSAYQQATEVHVWDGSQYRQCSEVHVWDGSAWQQVFSTSGTVTLTPTTITVNGFPGTVGIYFRTDGTVDKRENSVYTQINTGTDWLIPNGDTSNYEIKLSNLSYPTGFPDSSGYTPTLGSWGDFLTDRYFRMTESFATTIATIDVSIRDKTTLDVLATATFTLEVRP